MVNAIVLMKVDPARINEVAQKLLEVQAVHEVFSTAGRYDLVALVRVREHETLAEVVTSGCLAIEGIQGSETLVAFKAYSRHDLERMFDLD
ncbi:Transcription regulator, AsnC-type [Desulfovibrio sp. X2]|uniref:Lrp/AsnC family transcriptional regulator n=1 Tax=Desulfovibrio sp. X2 TaxID=941449 RepID=UPI000358E212|nr:Lrp/AsnC ligand binding domain-containing protein [Desulfovibrio sp. X2]EPR43412.1 Transcription regulator, AsnC-type [Desulfovibrio sp. X2]